MSPGFQGRPRSAEPALPPGQYLTEDFPVLSAGPTPRVPLDTWEFVITTETGAEHRWSWDELMALPQETPTVDIHCVTRWSKLGTNWQGVSLDTLLDGVDTAADYALVALATAGTPPTCRWTTCAAARPGWCTATTAGRCPPSTAARPGCWCRTSTSGSPPSGCAASGCWCEDEPGFWETAGYHDYGDPWREQRYQGD